MVIESKKFVDMKRSPIDWTAFASKALRCSQSNPRES
jgi:hypothetical protein